MVKDVEAIVCAYICIYIYFENFEGFFHTVYFDHTLSLPSVPHLTLYSFSLSKKILPKSKQKNENQDKQKN